MTIEIRRFERGDTDGVIGLILPIQQDEFGVPITVEDQPDLKAIPDFYQTGLGDFWVAVTDEGRIVGTISLKDIGGNVGALRKMFVAAEWRGREHGVARQLLERLLTTSRERGIRSVFLGTTDKFHAAHRFYEKNGFVEIVRADLPKGFPLIAVDTKFYAITL